jgi:hypothetical protein
MNLPKHISLTIEHQPHAVYYDTVKQWLDEAARLETVDISLEDAAEMLRTGEVWEVHWYPRTPVSWCAVAAATLERALELALEAAEEEDPGPDILREACYGGTADPRFA